MGNIVRRKIKGRHYFYLEKTVKFGEKKWRKVSVYLGKEVLSKKELLAKEKKLGKKVKSAVLDFYNEKLGNFKFNFLTRKELAELERLKDNFWARFDKLSPLQKIGVEKKQVIDFVYTTLRTEGIDVNFSDVKTAYRILGKKKGKPVFSGKVIISSSMITGFNFLPKIKLDEKDVLRLHGIVMSYFEDKTPGQLRDDQRIIAKFNPKTLQSEEINYRPPKPEKIKKLFNEFFDWLNANSGTHPIELASLVHLKIYLIHPFKDGNKRMCRLLFNKVLMDSNYPMINISKNTSKYFEALSRSVETGEEKFFVKYCYKTFIEQVKHKRLN
ncbi:MAG: Fic family protein [archaeon]